MLIKGKVEEIIYRNTSNGYTVMSVTTDSASIDAVGTMPFLNAGDDIEFEAELIEHPVYGEQFKVIRYTRLEPQTESDIATFLASGILTGIREATAKKIVKEFGDQSLAICLENPSKLAQIRGISVERALKIGAEYREFLKMEELLTFMDAHGIPMPLAARINRDMGSMALEMIKDNPYILVTNGYGVDFTIADRIATEFEKDGDSYERLSCAIIYVLLRQAENGHTFFPYQQLLAKTCRLLNCSYDSIEDALSSLEGLENVFILDENVYLPRLYNAEMYVAEKMLLLDRSVVPFEEKQIDDIMVNIEKNQGFTLAELQRKAVLQSATNGVLIITGGPGTGKTTIIRTIITLFERLGLKIKLAAPTGRAAKRITEATDRDASTIHRMLELVFSNNVDEPIFMKNETTPLETDVVIIDETSMVDILLMNSLLRAIEPGTRIILVGDSNQLPSVGAGNVLRDLICAEAFNTVELIDVFRQAGESMIVVNAHKILRGEELTLNQKDNDFYFIPQRGGVDAIAETVADVYARRLPRTYGYDSLRDIQVITPTRKGNTGVTALNRLLHQRILDRDIAASNTDATHTTSTPDPKYKRKIAWNGTVYHIGDKIMQIRNDYQLEWIRTGNGVGIEEGTGVFNGDMGIVTAIDERGGTMTVRLDDDRLVEYDKTVFDDIEWAYAITVHKSQGSEFPAVIIPMTDVHRMLMYRNLIYTGVTRARQLVVVVGEIEALYKMINNDREESRFSSLRERIDELIG